MLPQTERIHQQLRREARFSSDLALSQHDQSYLVAILRENGELRERNAYLEDWARRADAELAVRGQPNQAWRHPQAQPSREPVKQAIEHGAASVPLTEDQKRKILN